jgi:hypothetical protein
MLVTNGGVGLLVDAILQVLGVDGDESMLGDVDHIVLSYI